MGWYLYVCTYSLGNSCFNLVKSSGRMDSIAGRTAVAQAAVQGLTGVSTNNNDIPSEYKLHQNYPNPFNPKTKISFDIPKSSNVKLIIYDISGKELGTFINEFQSAGTHSFIVDGSVLSSGVYFYKLIAGDFSDIKKMILVK